MSFAVVPVCIRTRSTVLEESIKPDSTLDLLAGPLLVHPIPAAQAARVRRGRECA
jgi:hypothetical protein